MRGAADEDRRGGQAPRLIDRLPLHRRSVANERCCEGCVLCAHTARQRAAVRPGCSTGPSHRAPGGAAPAPAGDRARVPREWRRAALPRRRYDVCRAARAPRARSRVVDSHRAHARAIGGPTDASSIGPAFSAVFHGLYRPSLDRKVGPAAAWDQGFRWLHWAGVLGGKRILPHSATHFRHVREGALGRHVHGGREGGRRSR